MSRKCEICGKGQVSGNAVSHSNRHSRRKWNPNIQTVKINDNGTVRRAKVCTRCIRSNKITRAVYKVYGFNDLILMTEGIL